jgi:signal transduction histidine kinase
VGIPTSEQNRIFTKFYRGSNVIKMQTEGSGLGLFIVKNIIKRHKGKICFESRAGGTTFYITLPIYDELTKKK